MKRRGSKLQRSETITVRLDKRMRYLTEIAARAQRRTVSSFIDWAVAEALTRQMLGTDTVAAHGDALWDADEWTRLENLAAQFPYLLTYDEELRLKEGKS